MLNIFVYVHSFVMYRAIPIQWVIDQADEMHVYTEHSSGRLNILFKTLLRLDLAEFPVYIMCIRREATHWEKTKNEPKGAKTIEN